MSQIADQITAEETARLQEQVGANVLARLQGALQSSRDKRASMDADIAELEAEVSSRLPQPVQDVPSEEQSQG